MRPFVLRFCPLASGSKGNAYFLQTKETTLLIDAGLSMRETQKRLSQIGATLTDIDAIIVTHEHHDHIAGIKTITSTYPIPILANYQTAESIVETIDDCPQFKIFTTGEPFEFQDVEIHPFSILHDAIEPIALTINTGTHSLGICTDIGFMTKTVLSKLKNCNALVLEANHQPDFVLSSPRPDAYKKRVLSRLGHLSNQACAEALAEIAHPQLKNVYLAHLSSECNSKEKARHVIGELLESRNISLSLDIALQEVVSKEIIF